MFSVGDTVVNVLNEIGVVIRLVEDDVYLVLVNDLEEEWETWELRKLDCVGCLRHYPLCDGVHFGPNGMFPCWRNL